jgi:hypothetical protein
MFRDLSSVTLASALAICLVAVSAPAASATTIREGSTSGPLFSGEIVAVSNGGLFTKGIKLVTTSGTVECERLELEGELASNGTGEIGRGKFSEANIGRTEVCATTFSPSGTTARVLAHGLPWTVSIVYKSTTDNPLTITGNIELKVELSTSVTCLYKTSEIEGLWSNFSEIETFETSFTKASGSGASCPRVAILGEARFGVLPDNLAVAP